MYGYQGNQFGGPPFGGFGGPSPPGYGPPPGMGKENMTIQRLRKAPPGFAPEQQFQEGPRPSGFQPPPNMPNINMSAPIIRLGMSGPTTEGGEQRPARTGLGMDSVVQRPQSSMPLLQPTKDEIVKTIYVGGLSEALDRENRIERILQSAGPLRRWIRAIDAMGRTCKFGFAEYETSEGLSSAIEILRDVEILTPMPVSDESDLEDDDGRKPEQKFEATKLAIFVDDASYRYIEHWESSREDQDPIQSRLRLDAAKSSLAQTLAKIADPSLVTEADRAAINGMKHLNEQLDSIVNIPLSIDEELCEVPAEMRELVAREISGFRERSARRDMERLRREEEMELRERRRAAGEDSRTSRMPSPPPSRSQGPAGGANTVPLGAKDRTLTNVPSGPRREVRENGVVESDESDVSDDEEVERRKQEKKAREEEKLYEDQKRRWMNREKSRAAALERERTRDGDKNMEARREVAARTLAEFDDDVEKERKTEEFYADHTAWARKRHTFRAHEARMDELDREEEVREQTEHREPALRSERPAKVEAATPKEPQRIKLSLGAAAQKVQAAQKAAQAQNTVKRTAAEVEGLLEDENEEEATARRKLKPIKFDNAADTLGLTEEERAQAARQLAADIPNDKAGLWKWPVKWDFVDETVLTEQLRPFVDKKIVEYLGVQEQMLVELVEEHIRNRREPQALVAELEGVGALSYTVRARALDEEAEVLVKKLWRMIIFFSESEKKGLSK